MFWQNYFSCFFFFFLLLIGSGGFRKRKHDNFPQGQKKEEKENVNPSSPLMTSFKSFQLELDTRHDKYERLVKLSRDITIESKRTIFLLHRFTSAPNGEEILNESEVKLDGVRRKIKQVAQELIGEDMYQFHRAISPGSSKESEHSAIAKPLMFYVLLQDLYVRSQKLKPGKMNVGWT
uniref:Uncharacterized protein n=1 Tax=Cairina moschata TaxID=8855 RepID=A0A8C3GP01_CAIMO